LSSKNNTPAGNDATNQKDVSLGPACLVVFVFGLMLLCIAVAFMSFMLTGNQGPRAAQALRKQLIPWVDDSALSKADQSAIIDELSDLASQMERGELTSRQLSRLGIRLTDSTILQWGVVEDVLRYTKASKGFNDEEKEDIQKTCDRWLRCASEGKLSMTEMEFAFQGIALKEPRSGRLSLLKELTDDQVREFHRRVLGVCEKYKTSTEPFNKSVSQVFHMMMEDGLSEK
jgi:hypothetical protein